MERVNLNLQAILPALKQKTHSRQQVSFNGMATYADNMVKPSLENLKANFISAKSPVSFGRKLEDHMRWGATVLPDGKVNFKVWAPYVNEMNVQIRSKDAQAPKDDHTPEEIKEILAKNDLCGMWKYDLDKISQNKWHYLFGKPENATTVKMKKGPEGIFEITLDAAKSGDMYRFLLNKNDERGWFPNKDPRSQSQPFDVHGWSEIVDEDGYNWKNDKSWEKHPNKLRHAGPVNALESPAKMVCDEIHIGTFTQKGDFESAMKKLEQIAKDGIYNTVEIMPVNEFFGHRNWGYEGVDQFAPESSYGGPKAFKALIDRAHELGLNVLLDVVYNHMGPFYNSVGEYGKYFDDKKSTPWGGAINYENGKDAKHVRNFVVDNALHWLKNYHLDGLRLDMTKFMESDVTLKEIAFEVRKHKPEAILVTEDARNTKRLVRPIHSNEIDPSNEAQEAGVINNGNIDFSKLKNLGYDGQWNFDFQHTLEALVTGQNVGDYGPSVNDLMNEFNHNFKWHDGYDNDLGLQPAHTNVNYVMSHDEAGNRDGTRIITKVLQNRLGLNAKIKDYVFSNRSKFEQEIKNSQIIRKRVGNREPNHKEIENMLYSIAGQRAARVALDLTKAYVNHDTSGWAALQGEYALNISRSEFEKAFKSAKSLNKLAISAVFMSPGAKMMLMGDEEGELAPFKFSSEYPVHDLEEWISCPMDKGYSIGEKAFNDSKVGQKKNTDSKTKKFTQDLAKLFYENPALHNGSREKMGVIAHEGSKVMGVHRYEDGNEIYAVMNFGDADYNGNYGIRMPFGVWKQVLSSNEIQYGGNGECMNNEVAGQGNSALNGKNHISLPKQSIVIFKKIK